MTQPIRHAGPVDTTSSAARQHFIETGEWPRAGETFPVEPFDGPHGYGLGSPRIETAVAAGHEPPRYGNEAPTSNPDARAVPIDTNLADYAILPAHVVRQLRLLITEDPDDQPTPRYRALRARVLLGEIRRILTEEIL